MKIKSVFYYQARLFCTPVLVYFLIVIGLYLIGCIPAIVMKDGAEQTIQFSGFDISGVIFIFIMGLCSFKPSFRFFIGNSISRKSQFWGTVGSLIALAAVMSLITTLFSVFFPLLTNYSSFFYIIYNAAYAGLDPKMLYTSVPFLLTCFLWTFLLFLAAAAAGYFLTVFAYRMSKALKLFFFIGVPVLFVVIIPIIDTYLTQMTISHLLVKAVVQSMGFAGFPPNPYIACITFTGITVVFFVLSYLCIRRAVLKEG